MKKKIFKLSAIFCLSVFFFSLTIPSHASVADGRASLFSDGSPTYSGILAANEQFEAAVTDNPLDQEANLFYAITRILASGLEEGGAAELETVRDLLEAFGVSRNDVDLVDTDVPFNDPPLMYDEYDPPETMPGGEDVRAFLAGPFVTLLDAAIANLGKIGSGFTTILTTVETGDDYDIEVDYGDVLLLKSALYMLKSTILIATAYDLDVNLRELIVFGNAGVLQFQRDLLVQYPYLFSLRTADGAASLSYAKTALLAGIDGYDAALTFIGNKSDPRTNNLFYLEPGEDQREAEFLLTQLTELKTSLGGNRAAVFTTIYEEWLFTDTSTDTELYLRADIEKDVNENFVSGDYWGLSGCDFISCGGWVEGISIVGGGQSNITLAYGGWFSGSATFTGETNSAGTSIEGTYKEYNNLGVETGSGTFTALRQSQEIETETIDFNCIFGSATKTELDIRAILPQFDQYGEPIADTFPVPVLNGVLPEIATNQDLTDEMGLQPAAVNTSSISGTITCTAPSESGNIFVWAYDGPDWRYAHWLGGAVADDDRNYTIEGLAVGASVYLFARWDADDNGIKTFGDYWGRKIESVEVTSGGTPDVDFSTDTPIDNSYIMTKPGLYRVFGSNTYTIPNPQYYYGPWNPNEIDWGSGWTFIGVGESNKTETFNATQYYKTILMIWHEGSSFNFDAIEDLTANTAFATNADGTSCVYSWLASGLRNFDTDQWTEPSYFKGHPDGLYVNTAEWYGFNLFPMPDDTVDNNTSRDIKITLILKGDVDGDGDVDLGDAILALKVVAGLSPDGINLNADVNGDGRIGLAEVIYAIQHAAGLE